MTDLHATTVDWRRQLQLNKTKTRWVIVSFILIYLAVGLLVDFVIQVEMVGQDVSYVLARLVAGDFVPYSMLIMGGIAVLAIMITYALYDKIMLLGTNSKLITPNTAMDQKETQLYNVVEEMKIAAGLHYMPQIHIIEANYMNAFATGYSEKSALVAITRGLLNKLDRNELMAVMAHELSHVRHMDIKLTLTVAVLSNIMLIVSDIFFYRPMFNNGRSERRGNGLIIFVMLLRYLLPLITMLLTLYLSRTREYMADAGCVELMRDNEPLARALIKIHEDHEINRETYKHEYGETAHEDIRRAAYLYDPVKAGIEPVNDITSLFSTHPKLSDRLKAIGIRRKGKGD